MLVLENAMHLKACKFESLGDMFDRKGSLVVYNNRVRYDRMRNGLRWKLQGS